MPTSDDVPTWDDVAICVLRGASRGLVVDQTSREEALRALLVEPLVLADVSRELRDRTLLPREPLGVALDRIEDAAADALATAPARAALGAQAQALAGDRSPRRQDGLIALGRHLVDAVARSGRVAFLLSGAEARPARLVAGRYRVLGLLGRGRFATVYRARDEREGGEVALKLFSEEVRRDLSGRVRDALGPMLALEEAPDALVRPLEVVAGDALGFSCLLAPGVNARTLLRRRGRLPWDEARGIVVPVLRALAAAHAAGVLHLDVRPGNVFADDEGAVHLLDLGVGRVLGPGRVLPLVAPPADERTHEAELAAYAAPEVEQGQRGAAASDVFSVAALAHALLVGAPPARGRFRTPRECGAEVPEGVERALLRALASAPGDRFPTAAAFRDALLAGDGAPRAIVTHDVRRGWFGEPLPRGLEPGPRKPAYAFRTPAGFALELVHVPAGPFLMGSDDFFDEQPRHEHHLEAFWIGRFPVTWLQYRLYCEATGRTPPPPPRHQVRDECPVVNVTWDDARAFCAWAGLRLPTEPEWEKAARGTDGRRFPWGDEPPTRERCVWSGHPVYGRWSSAPVGICPDGASPYGVMDAAGNVTEWCASLYEVDAYARHARGERGEAEGTARVHRGGCWWDGAAECRTTARGSYLPSSAHEDLGFRVALDGHQTVRPPGLLPPGRAG